MSDARPEQLRLLTPDQDNLLQAVIRALFTGDYTGVPEFLVDDIEAVRAQSRLGVEKIDVGNGILLDASASWPLTDGPHPLIVMPAGLDKTGWRMYAGSIVRLLMRGYAVVAYSERGLAESGGALTVAGPEDVADGRAVIDWALNNSELRADPDKIGMTGISYGSGISQLVANADERVKAVVALSTWADLGEALYDNQTRHVRAAEQLATIGHTNSADLEIVLGEFRANNMKPVLAYAAERSPALMETIRPVPTFFTSFWHETIFPQNQLLAYFERFPGPKRLDLAVGDHGAVEIPGVLLGVYTRTTEAAYDWFDHYLLDVDNGIDRDGIVHTEGMYTFGQSTAPNLAAWSNPMRRYHFQSPGTESSDGLLAKEPPQSFTKLIQVGTQQVRAAEALVMDGFAERLLMPKRQKLATVDREAAGVWTTRFGFLKPQHIAGTPEVHATVKPSTEAVTLIAYLFDHNPFTGSMRIITHAATTVKNMQPNQATAIQLPLRAIEYQVPIGHKLAMIIDTKDHFYMYDEDDPAPGGTVILSNEHGQAYIDIPMTY
ncbi:alpha/beta fold hydrolase [Nocardia sp. NPDC051030]|uniref:alpha/beta fold hydrolase n=1 Tax=Nocardia sp. NPDC051030 TaxID=3155162 RepID=UPI00344167F9